MVCLLYMWLLVFFKVSSVGWGVHGKGKGGVLRVFFSFVYCLLACSLFAGLVALVAFAFCIGIFLEVSFLVSVF
ncbi:hypothetical protein BDV95DRAFT_585600 [Massariosphaeria phaeospora]|uniref:Uncharacterized protein n=1 Tax=Massariosphaeria phaeospora TaxID=100035 RepID=A0A7C8M0G7_9PLEO|nr:hypothetical protein BDV95DRAFT_585600 [Massariosphaeria phaeospora]